jgi:hypothetical protein
MNLFFKELQLAHTIAAKKYKSNNYSMSPQDIIQGIKIL